MPKYRVYIDAVASTMVEVEAEDENEAIELALEQAPSNNATTNFDLGEWSTPSDLFPEHNKPEDDYELIED